MITEDYCSYKVAKLLKEKGFEIDTNKDYWKIGEDGTMYFMSSIGAYTSNPNNEYAFYRPENSYPCPTHQTAMKWLREDKHIFIEIKKSSNTFLYGASIVKDCSRYYSRILNAYNTYEELVEAALNYCLENLI